MKPIIRSSEMDRILSCPGSLTLTRLVAARDGDEGWEGSFIHWAIADRLIREHGAIPPDGGLPPPDVPKDYKLPAFSRWIIDWAIRHVLSVVPPTWSIMVEVEMEYEFGRWLNRGHADVVAFSPDGTESLGIDWKTGRDPVDPADNNEQVFSYTCLKKLNWDGLKKSTFQICQPRVDEDEGYERISTVVLEGERLEIAAQSLDDRTCMALDQPMELNSGRKQCAYCSAATQCPALQKERDEMKLTLTPDMLAGIKKAPDDAVLADWVIASKTLARPIEDAEKIAKERIASEGAIVASDGTRITIKTSRGSYTIVNHLALWDTLHELLPKDKLALCAKWRFSSSESGPGIKDQIAKHMDIPATGKAAVTATSVFDARMRTHVEQGEKQSFQFQ